MTQILHFEKMHGLGNDFVVVDAITHPIDIKKISLSLLANRHLGIGFDQFLLIEKSTQADFACRIFNADGSEAEQCGNGMRCVGLFIYEKKLSTKKTFTIETQSTLVEVFIKEDGQIQVTLGTPCFQPEKIPFLVDREEKLYSINIDDSVGSLIIAAVSMGNPHAILCVPSIKDCAVSDWGKKIGKHSLFPQSANVGFMQIVNRQHIKLRTFERGVGETHACGSNACAAVVAGILNDWLDSKVSVELFYGNITVEWLGENNPVIMTGPATRVFSGVT